MKKIRTEELREGMKFTQAVYIDKNNILVGPNVAVKQKDIDRLLSWGISQLETSGELSNYGSSLSKDDSNLSEVERREAELRKIVALQQRDKSTPEQDSEESVAGNALVTNYAGWVKAQEIFFDQAKSKTKIDSYSVKKIVEQIIANVSENKHQLIATMKQYESDQHIYVHGVNVAILGAIMGLRQNFDSEKLFNLVTGCLFIDIGMVLVPDYIINKKGKLSQEEIKKIHTHPVYGYKILVQDNGFSLEAGRVALEHHEQCDGHGYPRKLNASQISIYGKIGAVLDTYDAMTKRRSYRDEFISYYAMRNILSAGQQKFDPEILKVFLKEMGIFPVGSSVLLSNNCVAEVVETNPDLPMRPIVKIFKDENGARVTDSMLLSLADDENLFIVKAIEEKRG